MDYALQGISACLIQIYISNEDTAQNVFADNFVDFAGSFLIILTMLYKKKIKLTQFLVFLLLVVILL